MTSWRAMVGFAVAFVGGVAEAGTEFDEVRRRAERGDVEAQYALGVRYRDGEEVAEDGREAIFWFRRAAEKSSVSTPSELEAVALAQMGLGNMYWSGQRVAPDYDEAAKWLRLAAGHVGDPRHLAAAASLNLKQATLFFADEGDDEAQYVLGLWHIQGVAVERDLAQAIYWLQNAADQRHAASHYDLGILFEHAIRDPVAAHALYAVAKGYNYREGPRNPEVALAGIAGRMTEN